jgi:hypothetical protein
LFFERRDPIAIHTFATAAQEILRALAQPRGIKGIYEHADALIRPDKKKELIDHLRKAQNFFKHAAKDPGEKSDFFYEATQFYLFDDVLLWTPLTVGTTMLALAPAEIAAFSCWFLAKYPDIFTVNDNPTLQGLMRVMKGVNVEDFDLVLYSIDHFNKTKS